MCQAFVLRGWHVFFACIVTEYYHQLHFTDEEVKAQRGEVHCLRPRSC